MSISSSMNAGVAGLSAQAMTLATISDNIAHAQTAGYRRAGTDFAAMVVGSGSGGAYVAGGVRAESVRYVDARGSLTTTTNATDLAVAGRGMLPVTTANAVAADATNLPFLMTPTGSFRPDADGYLKTPSGLVLLGVPVGPDGAPPAFPRSSTAALEPVRIPQNEIAGRPTTAMTVAANLPAASTEAGATAGPESLQVTYYDNLGKAQTLDFAFTPTVPAAGSPPSNTWTLEITDSASGSIVGEYTMAFDNDRATGGRLLSVATVSGGAYDPTTGGMTLNVAGGPLDLTIGQPGAAGGFTQLAADFAPITMEKDGAAAAALTGVEVDASGYVVARYDSGDTRRLFQVPVADVPNLNGLVAGSNGTFTPSQASGAFFLWDAGSGPTGAVQGFAREESSVDVAQELTQLIRTQRAYSSNAKVIQTVDEMLQETTNLKR